MTNPVTPSVTQKGPMPRPNPTLLSGVHSGDNWGMKLPLRYFLIISILLGAVAIPVGWRSYQKWKANEIERMEKELAARCLELEAYLRENSGGLRSVDATPPPRLREPIERIEDSLEELTGVRPERLRRLLEKHAATEYE